MMDRALDNYWCVFMGNPRTCTPLALFGDRKLAEIYQEDLGGTIRLILVKEWRFIYEPRKKNAEP